MARKSISKTSAYFQKMELGGLAKKNKSNSTSTLRPNIQRGGVAKDLGNNFYYMSGKKHKDGGIDVGKDLEVEDGEVMHVTPRWVKVYSSLPILNGESPAQMVLGGFNPSQVFAAQEQLKKINGINDDGTLAEFGTQRKPARRGYTPVQRKKIIEETNTPRTHQNAAELQKNSEIATTALMSVMATPLIANASVAGATSSMISEGTNVATKARPIINFTKEVVKGVSQGTKDAMIRGAQTAGREIIRDSKDLYQGRVRSAKSLWKGVKAVHRVVNAAPREVIKSPYTVPRYLYKNISKEELSKISGIIGSGLKQVSKYIVGKGAQGIKAVAKNAWNNPVDYVLAGIVANKLFNNSDDNNSTEPNATSVAEQKPVVKSKQNKNNITKKEPEEETKLTITPADTTISKVNTPVISKPVENKIEDKVKPVINKQPVVKTNGRNKKEDEIIQTDLNLQEILDSSIKKYKKFGGRQKAAFGAKKDYIPIYGDISPEDEQIILDRINQNKTNPNFRNQYEPRTAISDKGLLYTIPATGLTLNNPTIGFPTQKLKIAVPKTTPAQLTLDNNEIRIPDSIKQVINPTKNNKGVATNRERLLGDNSFITRWDIAEAGANTLFNALELANNLIFNKKQRREIDSRRFVSAPLIKLNNTVGINPQLHALNQQMMAAQNSMLRNTSSSNVALNRFNALTSAANQKMIELYNDKYNKENENINKQILTNAGITQQNVGAYNSFLDRQSADRIKNYEERAKAISDAFNAQSTIFGNFENRLENRTKNANDFMIKLADMDKETRAAFLAQLNPRFKRRHGILI